MHAAEPGTTKLGYLLSLDSVSFVFHHHTNLKTGVAILRASKIEQPQMHPIRKRLEQ